MTLVNPHKADTSWWTKHYATSKGGNALIGGSSAGHLTSDPDKDLAMSYEFSIS